MAVSLREKILGLCCGTAAIAATVTPDIRNWFLAGPLWIASGVFAWRYLFENGPEEVDTIRITGIALTQLTPGLPVIARITWNNSSPTPLMVARRGAVVTAGAQIPAIQGDEPAFRVFEQRLWDRFEEDQPRGDPKKKTFSVQLPPGAMYMELSGPVITAAQIQEMRENKTFVYVMGQ